MEQQTTFNGPRRVILTFYEVKDDLVYALCEVPGHTHYVPAVFKSCYDKGGWTWESLYAHKE